MLCKVLLFENICRKSFYFYFPLAITGLSAAKRFNIFNEQGQLVFRVAEGKMYIYGIYKNFVFRSKGSVATCLLWSSSRFQLCIFDLSNQVRSDFSDFYRHI
jgi:hypothetical protein